MDCKFKDKMKKIYKALDIGDNQNKAKLAVDCLASYRDECGIHDYCTDCKGENNLRVLTGKEVASIMLDISEFKKILSIDDRDIDIINKGNVIHEGLPVQVIPLEPEQESAD